MPSGHREGRLSALAFPRPFPVNHCKRSADSALEMPTAAGLSSGAMTSSCEDGPLKFNPLRAYLLLPMCAGGNSEARADTDCHCSWSGTEVASTIPCHPGFYEPRASRVGGGLPRCHRPDSAMASKTRKSCRYTLLPENSCSTSFLNSTMSLPPRSGNVSY